MKFICEVNQLTCLFFAALFVNDVMDTLFHPQVATAHKIPPDRAVEIARVNVFEDIGHIKDTRFLIPDHLSNALGVFEKIFAQGRRIAHVLTQIVEQIETGIDHLSLSVSRALVDVILETLGCLLDESTVPVEVSFSQCHSRLAGGHCSLQIAIYYSLIGT